MVETRNKTMKESFKRVDKEVIELSGIIKAVSSKSDGLENSLKILSNKQENAENSLKDLNVKYDHVVAYMAQLNQTLTCLSKDKGVAESPVQIDPHISFMGSRNGETSAIHSTRGDGKSIKMPKVDFTFFDGENPKEWVRKANKFVQIHEVADELKTSYAEMYMKD